MGEVQLQVPSSNAQCRGLCGTRLWTFHCKGPSRLRIFTNHEESSQPQTWTSMISQWLHRWVFSLRSLSLKQEILRVRQLFFASLMHSTWRMSCVPVLKSKEIATLVLMLVWHLKRGSEKRGCGICQ